MRGEGWSRLTFEWTRMTNVVRCEALTRLQLKCYKGMIRVGLKDCPGDDHDDRTKQNVETWTLTKSLRNPPVTQVAMTSPHCGILQVMWINPDYAPGLLWDTSMGQDSSKGAQVRDVMVKAFNVSHRVRKGWRGFKRIISTRIRIQIKIGGASSASHTYSNNT